MLEKQEEVFRKYSNKNVNILSITIESDVPACLESKLLDPLLWFSKFAAKEIDDGSALRRPGVFVIPTPAKDKLGALANTLDVRRKYFCIYSVKYTNCNAGKGIYA